MGVGDSCMNCDESYGDISDYNYYVCPACELKAPKTEGKYILDGQTPVACDDLFKWAEWFERSGEQRVVAQSTINGYWISTVFIGIDCSYGLSDRPLLFETLVFQQWKDRLTEVSGRRWSTWKEARIGHDNTVVEYST